MMLSIGGDILQFVGLAFLLVGILKKLRLGPAGMLVVAVALNAAAVIFALQGGPETFPNYHNGYHV